MDKMQNGLRRRFHLQRRSTSSRV